MVLRTAVNNKHVKKKKNISTIQSIKAEFIGHSFHSFSVPLGLDPDKGNSKNESFSTVLSSHQNSITSKSLSAPSIS